MKDKQIRKKKTHCKYGHLYDNTNVYFDKKRGVRQCKKCKYERSVRYYKENPKRLRENSRNWRLRHPEKARENDKKYILNNPEKRKILNKKGKLKHYGLTLEKYNEILLLQLGVCAICNKKETNKHQSGVIKSLAVDHDHKNGKVRGLLCTDCNLGLGNFKDDTSLLMSAIKYLNT